MRMNDLGLNDITMSKTALIAILQTNMRAHKDVYEVALAKYRETAIAGLDALIARVRAGESVLLSVHAPVPEDHTNDYRRAIGMLDADISDTVTLSEDAYSKLVDDEWEWTASWTTSNTFYGISAS